MVRRESAIRELLEKDWSDQKGLSRAKRLVARKHGIGVLENAGILACVNGHKLKVPGKKLRLLRKRAVRTLSGIAPVAVLTKPHPCPGRCAYCPTEKDVPQSYLSNEPAVMRAIRCGYNPYTQVQDRLRALVNNGHEPTKIELIVIGGTWSYLPEKYKHYYIANLFKAANDFLIDKSFSNSTPPRTRRGQGWCDYEKSAVLGLAKDGGYKFNLKLSSIKQKLAKEQKRNEKTKYKIVGLTVETRPDYINEKELWQMRELGVTRVEMGVQAVDDEILRTNKRGHGVKEIAEATQLLKDSGFKVTYHIMPSLPGSSAARDLKMFKQLFTDERFRPDQIKFYPTVVTKGSLLYRWWRQGKYKPYTDKQLSDLVIKCKAVVPPYVRIIRLIRDIPGESIMAGNKITNLRQVMQSRGAACNCIRCREIKGGAMPKGYKLSVMSYAASGGQEYFIEAVGKGNDGKLLGFCRLRVSSRSPQTADRRPQTADRSGLESIALVRELHVYGELVSVGSGRKKTQHSGLGKKLFLQAEKIAQEQGCKKISIISGVGVRGYYRKQGYRLNNTYMAKNLT